MEDREKSGASAEALDPGVLMMRLPGNREGARSSSCCHVFSSNT